MKSVLTRTMMNSKVSTSHDAHSWHRAVQREAFPLQDAYGNVLTNPIKESFICSPTPFLCVTISNCRICQCCRNLLSKQVPVNYGWAVFCSPILLTSMYSICTENMCQTGIYWKPSCGNEEQMLLFQQTDFRPVSVLWSRSTATHFLKRRPAPWVKSVGLRDVRPSCHNGRDISFVRKSTHAHTRTQARLLRAEKWLCFPEKTFSNAIESILGSQLQFCVSSTVCICSFVYQCILTST